MPTATVKAFGTQAAQPTSGLVEIALNGYEQYPFLAITFTLTGARVPVTDGGASGSYGALKLFTFNEQAVQLIGSRHNWTAFAEGSALTTGAGDAAFVIAFGSAAVAAAADGALSGTSVNFGATRSITNSGGTGTGATTVTGAQTPLDGTSTPVEIWLNWSGTAASIDANSYIDVTGTFSVVFMMLGDD